jgi:hypothetical protein
MKAAFIEQFGAPEVLKYGDRGSGCRAARGRHRRGRGQRQWR